MIIKFAAMEYKVWCILASFLLVSVGANRYDRGPQKFYDVSFDSASTEQNEHKEVILFLTPYQVRALEAEGAVVRSSESPENEKNESTEPLVSEDQFEETENGENYETEQEQDAKLEQENSQCVQDQDLDLEEILRLLNEEQVEKAEEEETAEERARSQQVEKENTEKERNLSPRFSFRQQQQQEQRYLAPASAIRERTLKSYSSIRYQPTEQPQRINVQLKQQEEADDESNEESRTETPTQERKKYKLVPYEVYEALEEPSQEENAETQQNLMESGDTQSTSNLIADRQLAKAIGQRKNKLQENELQLQSILRELKASPKHNDQKYAIEIQRLKANLEKQNALSKAEAIAKITPFLIKQQFTKKQLLNRSAQEKSSATGTQVKTHQQKKNKAIPKTARPIPVPVETGKILSPSVENIYVKGRPDKFFTVSRRTPESKKRTLVEVPKSRLERISLARHIWDN